MKRNIIVVGIIVLAGIGIFLFGKYVDPQTITVEKPVEKTVPVEVDALERRIQEAIIASSTEIEQRAKNAYDSAKSRAEAEVHLYVIEQHEKDVAAMKEEVVGQVFR